jgi:plastin-1
VRGDGLAVAMKSGLVPLQLLDAVQPGLVPWGRVNKSVTNRYKMIENCNTVIELGRAMDFHLVNVSGLDICDGNAKMVMAFMWQLMRYAAMRQLSSLVFDGFEADEGEILRWVNARVGEAATAAGQEPGAVRIAGFNDPSLASGIFLLYLLASMREGVVDWDAVADGTTKEQQRENAGYIISLARRLGAKVFATVDDIVDVKARPLTLFVASLMVADSKARRGADADAPPPGGDDDDEPPPPDDDDDGPGAPDVDSD